MKKIDLGQTITILANVGVIAGIVFLAFELRQNNDQLALQAQAQLQERRNSIMALVINNPDLVELLGEDPAALTVAERDQVLMLGMRMLLNFEDQYQDVQSGVLDENAVIRQLRAVYHRPRMKHAVPFAWATYKQRATPDFQAWMEQNMIPVAYE
jgi:hypothetical protein